MKQKHYDVESMAKLINFLDSRAGLYIVLFLFRSLNRQFNRLLPSWLTWTCAVCGLSSFPRLRRAEVGTPRLRALR